MPRVNDAHLAARREQIVEAARGLFSAHGFARTTMKDIVRASGLSMGAVYRYFPSKSDLVLAVCEGQGGEVDGSFPVEPPEQLLSRLAGRVGPGEPHARMAIQIWGEAVLVPDLGERVVATHLRLEDHLARLLAEGRAAQAGNATARASAQLTLAALIGLAALTANTIPVDQERFIAALTELVRTTGDGDAPSPAAE
ncbi:TetR/AcrR family transcriptional regulator [Pseudonocardia spinosispora]|uniref:TetR/AcrR family transcriptional regulator n=1 Tax=Pseudonocardia spinosispora TaxID=103441 RepID=UPI00041AF5FE|nr:TetR/AcrR family transcriptional regulator [Pseudonocardia spinosispora]